MSVYILIQAANTLHLHRGTSLAGTSGGACRIRCFCPIDQLARYLVTAAEQRIAERDTAVAAVAERDKKIADQDENHEKKFAHQEKKIAHQEKEIARHKEEIAHQEKRSPTWFFLLLSDLFFVVGDLFLSAAVTR